MLSHRFPHRVWTTRALFFSFASFAEAALNLESTALDAVKRLRQDIYVDVKDLVPVCDGLSSDLFPGVVSSDRPGVPASASAGTPSKVLRSINRPRGRTRKLPARRGSVANEGIGVASGAARSAGSTLLGPGMTLYSRSGAREGFFHAGEFQESEVQQTARVVLDSAQLAATAKRRAERHDHDRNGERNKTEGHPRPHSSPQEPPAGTSGDEDAAPGTRSGEDEDDLIGSIYKAAAKVSQLAKQAVDAIVPKVVALSSEPPKQAPGVPPTKSSKRADKASFGAWEDEELDDMDNDDDPLPRHLDRTRFPFAPDLPDTPDCPLKQSMLAAAQRSLEVVPRELWPFQSFLRRDWDTEVKANDYLMAKVKGAGLTEDSESATGTLDFTIDMGLTVALAAHSHDYLGMQTKVSVGTAAANRGAYRAMRERSGVPNDFDYFVFPFGRRREGDELQATKQRSREQEKQEERERLRELEREQLEQTTYRHSYRYKNPTKTEQVLGMPSSRGDNGMPPTWVKAYNVGEFRTPEERADGVRAPRVGLPKKNTLEEDQDEEQADQIFWGVLMDKVRLESTGFRFSRTQNIGADAVFAWVLKNRQKSDEEYVTDRVRERRLMSTRRNGKILSHNYPVSWTT